MNARDARQLIADAIPRPGGVWADLGAGSGTFTRALAELLGPDGRIFAVDRDAGAVAALHRVAKKSPARVIPVLADFTGPADRLDLGDTMLDGLLFANALHFVADPADVLARRVAHLRDGGRVVVVEYDRRPASRWVPYPLPVERLRDLAHGAGLSAPAITASRPSAFGGNLYVAAADRER